MLMPSITLLSSLFLGRQLPMCEPCRVAACGAAGEGIQ